MAKKLFLVYQDCPMCGRRKEWGEKTTKVANDHGFEIVKLPFTKVGAKEIIFEGARRGMSLPFFTDGKGKFSMNIDDFVEYIETPEVKVETEEPQQEKKARKRTKKADK